MCKKLIYLVSFALVLGLATFSAGQEIAEGLVGYWPLDEGAGTATVDVSGNGSDGTLNGGPIWDVGKFGGALNFDGSDDHVDLGNQPILDFATGDWTVSAWIQVATAPSGDVTIYGKGGDHSSTALPGVRYQLMLDSDNYIHPVLDDDSSKKDPTGDITVIDGQWHHALMTRRNGTEFRLYVDGVEDMGATSDGDATLAANYDLSGTSKFNAYIGAIANAEASTLSTVVLEKYFSGLIDDVAVWSRALTLEEIAYLWNGGAGNPVDVAAPGQASDPYPEDEQTDVPRDVVLNWSPGDFAPATNGHTLYLSDIFNDVNDGIGGMTLSASSYTPEPRLDFGTTYYWRVDEVNGAPDFTVHPGEVWSFATEPAGNPIANVTATASSTAPNQGPASATVDGSGLTDDLHSTETEAMWISGFGAAQPSWIQFEFDTVYLLHEMWVWNSNSTLEQAVGFGFRDVTVEYSLDGTDYATLGTTHEFAQAPGAAGYAHNTTVDFGGLQAKYVRLTANSNWKDLLPQFGLSEVRFFHIPARAREPQPDSGATDVTVDVTLAWRAGRLAAEHNVYVSTDEQAVIDGNTPITVVTDASHGPLSLDLGSTYYWRVDEVNNVETPTIWQGDVWNFATQEFIVVDDFESYNDIDPPDAESNRIFEGWPDGFGVATNGALVGNDPANPSYAETVIVHGGAQSMPLFYSNTLGVAFSEATRTLAASDWTANGIQTLSLWFFGDPTNTPGQLYVKINGVQANYDGDSANLGHPLWQQWNIDLASVGTNLQSVTSLGIGVEGLDATGTLLFDDIALFRSAPAAAGVN